ncbi:hypothetical protein, partial [Falsigemmobacter faecalis]|uniref:hypothetical protein n=1 Tax=Falsigemmobacter faecalis TaxID=2488730 RepID=UPI001F1CB407
GHELSGTELRFEMTRPHNDPERARLERELQEARAEMTAVHDLCDAQQAEIAQLRSQLEDRTYEC